MDPQKNPINPAPYDAQQPLAGGTQPVAGSQQPAPSQTPQEVTIDFNQDAPASAGTASSSVDSSGGSFGDLPPISANDPAPQPQTPPIGGGPAQSATPFSAPGQPQSSPQPQGSFGPPSAPATPGYDPDAGRPLQPQDPYGPVPPTPAASAQPPQPGFGAPGAAQPVVGQPFSAPGQPPLQPQVQPFGPDPVPGTAPVTAPSTDKKTIFILAGVAVVLIIAIAVLFLM